MYEKSAGDNEIHRSSKWIMTFIKRMSNGKSEDSIDHEDYFEEMEWRLVHDERSTHFVSDESDVYRLKFKPSDIKVIILPDEIAKQQLLADGFIRKYFSEHLPIMATLDECTNF